MNEAYHSLKGTVQKERSGWVVSFGRPLLKEEARRFSANIALPPFYESPLKFPIAFLLIDFLPI